MNDNRYDNVEELMGAFQQFSRMNWQKTTMSGLKPSEIRVLITIRLSNKRDPANILTVSDLSRLLKVTSPTVTQMVNGLLAQGFVIRTSDAQDRRISGIMLTAKGEVLADKAIDKIHETFKGMIDYLGKEQSDTLIGLLNGVHAYFEQLGSQQDSQ
ncbi:MarR family transcriptional regulator [Paenibacillus sp. PK3_47]|uniref:MarR family winged helix-turn-helix transcriptional regulator n=1 Tax=Paenibacillus sp. PK3_47 TaxID=2072642 RepID=UPI00201E5AFE|nr:MarR family winged helix-turn-helix transcriptional regulator [Paenibacillus sp. PK3_47]UQZ35900.1 MarR family transcriptional regulator [Paenibacillus sp. PK3_47]